MNDSISERQTLPYSTACLVLGICSLLFCFFFVGLILGIIGIALSSSSRKMYRSNPSRYIGYGSLNAGFILSIIGVILSAITIVYYIVVGLFLVGVFLNGISYHSNNYGETLYNHHSIHILLAGKICSLFL